MAPNFSGKMSLVTSAAKAESLFERAAFGLASVGGGNVRRFCSASDASDQGAFKNGASPPLLAHFLERTLCRRLARTRLS